MSLINESHNQTQDLWNTIPPRMAFLFGLVSAVAVSGIIALVLILSGGIRIPGGSAIAGAPSPVAPVPAGAPVPSAPPSPVAAAGTVKPVDPKTDHVRGNTDAEVFVIEYSDFECPFCKRHHPTMQQLLSRYGDKVAWVYRHYPLSFHQNAQKEAEASECANELGGNDAFWKYTDKIFERTASNGTGFALDALVPLAKEIGLDEKKFKTCLDSGKYVPHIQQDMNEGQAAGISGTPGNIVWTKDGKAQLVEGAVPLQAFTTVIDPLLQ